MTPHSTRACSCWCRACCPLAADVTTPLPYTIISTICLGGPAADVDCCTGLIAVRLATAGAAVLYAVRVIAIADLAAITVGITGEGSCSHGCLWLLHAVWA